MDNPVRAISDLGQSVWIDHLDRRRLQSGDVRRRIAEDGLRGITSNPTIFERAISGDRIYDAPMRTLALRGYGPAEIYDAIVVEDIQLAADELRPIYDVDGRDGFVSLEVAPQLAYDARGTIDEARRLWREVARPNVLIKVPATRPGVDAIEALIAEGVNVNVTLLFGLDRYDQVANAYLAGLETRVRHHLSLRVASVASFFVSRIDVAVDAELDRGVREGRIAPELAARLRGRTAIASARIAYQHHKRLFADPRFLALEAFGASRQRMLWASTSTKDPAYPATYYVDALIGPGTIDTMPIETFEAYRVHGQPALRLEEDLDEARATLEALASTGIDLDEITHHLEHDGARKFSESYDKLLASIARHRDAALDDLRQHASG